MPAGLQVPSSRHREPSLTFAVARGSLSRMTPRHRTSQKSKAMVPTETLSDVTAGDPFYGRDGGRKSGRRDPAQVRRCPGEGHARAPRSPSRRREVRETILQERVVSKILQKKKKSEARVLGYLRSVTDKETQESCPTVTGTAADPRGCESPPTSEDAISQARPHLDGAWPAALAAGGGERAGWEAGGWRPPPASAPSLDASPEGLALQTAARKACWTATGAGDPAAPSR